MSARHDGLGRRKRIHPVSTGKRVTPQARDLLWFQKLQEHGPLPTSFLLHYARDTHRSEKRAKERLTDLFNEENTPHGGAYLARPQQQLRTLDSRYKQLVYDLTPAAKKVLKEEDLLEKRAARSGPWLHNFMVSCITASMELATMERDDIAFLSQSQLLKRSNADLRYPVTITDTAGGKEFTKHLIPDALFGLEYKTSKGSRYRCFLLEADRSTEPGTSQNFNRKSWQRNLLQYDDYIGRKLYRDHLQLKSPFMVLNVMTNQKRLEQVTKLVPKYAPAIQSKMLFQTWEDFGVVFSPPHPNKKLLQSEWSRSNLPDFRIDQV